MTAPLKVVSLGLPVLLIAGVGLLTIPGRRAASHPLPPVAATTPTAPTAGVRAAFIPPHAPAPPSLPRPVHIAVDPFAGGPAPKKSVIACGMPLPPIVRYYVIPPVLVTPPPVMHRLEPCRDVPIIGRYLGYLNNVQTGKTYAVFEDPSGRQRTLAVGATIDDMKVIAISPHALLLEKPDGSRVRLTTRDYASVEQVTTTEE